MSDLLSDGNGILLDKIAEGSNIRSSAPPVVAYYIFWEI
jgi:hypothetical protein